MTTPIRRRDKQIILQALRAGIAPGRGLAHLQVGRAAEIEALSSDLALVRDGGAAARFIVGDYGSGKTFFLQVIRNAAQKANCVTMHADISQDARLYGTGGRVLSLFSTLVSSTGTKSQPGGGAMTEVLESFITACIEESRKHGIDHETAIRRRVSDLRRFRGGHIFSDVIITYWRALRANDDTVRQNVVRWLRGEYKTKTESNRAIGVNGIIGDTDLLPSLQILATLIRKAGYRGLMVELDELAVLSRLGEPSRSRNYEQILTMINSLLGGESPHLAIVFSGTPNFVTDSARGLYSYSPLRQRISANEFLRDGLKDTASLLITLDPLSPTDLWVLLENVHRVYTSNGQRDPLPDPNAALEKFFHHAANQLGGLERVTAREVTRSWLHFLDILDQNRTLDWHTLLEGIAVAPDVEEPLDNWLAGSDSPMPATHSTEGAELADFQL